MRLPCRRGRTVFTVDRRHQRRHRRATHNAHRVNVAGRRASSGRRGTRARCRNARPTTSPPSRSTRRAVAAAVPPVASTSSTISTRSPGCDRVAVDLEQVGAVLELVLLALDLPRQLAGLADRHEPGRAAVRDRRREHEAARLDPEHLVDRARPRTARASASTVSGEGVGRREQRRDVLEDDARLRIVGDVAHVLLQRATSIRPCVPAVSRSRVRVAASRAGSLPALAAARCWRGRGVPRPRRLGCGRPRRGPAMPASPLRVSSRARRRRDARRRRGHAGLRPARTPRPSTRGAARSCERLVLRLPVLPPGEQRRGDEDRRVRADEQTDREREREVLERGRAHDHATRRSAARAPAAARRASSTANASAPRSATGSPSRRTSSGPVAVSVLLVLADLVEHDDGVVERETEDREERGDGRRASPRTGTARTRRRVKMMSWITATIADAAIFHSNRNDR